MTQATKSHAGRAEAMTQRALNETLLPMRKKGKMRRKILPFRTSSTGSHQYSPTWGHEKRGPTSEVNNKIRKTRKS